MTHSEVLALRDGDRVFATEAGGAADRPRYEPGTTGKVVRFELSSPAVIADDGRDLGFVAWWKWEMIEPRTEKIDRRHRHYGDVDANAASCI